MNVNVQGGVLTAANRNGCGCTKPEQITVWNEADFCLLHSLAIRVPLFSEAQAIHALKAAGCSHTTAVNRLNQLREAGWLKRLRATLNWPCTAQAPRVRWSPGEPEPELGRMRTIVRRSANSAGVRSISVYVASRWTANLFGRPYRGTASLELVQQWLAWAQVYLHLLQHDPQSAHCCDCGGVPSPGDRPRRMPAHLAFVENGATQHIVGLLCHSSASGLDAFHEHCVQQAIPYQLW